MKKLLITTIFVSLYLALFSCENKRRDLASLSGVNNPIEILTKGDMPKGFGNKRLPQILGAQIIIKEGNENYPGEYRLSYAVLIKFKIPPNLLAKDIEIKREALFQTSYYLSGEKRETGIRKILDNPTPENILVENGFILVADSPGPSALVITKNPSSYPISFEGLFNLKFLFQGEVLGETKYKIFLRKENFNDSKLSSSFSIDSDLTKF